MGAKFPIEHTPARCYRLPMITRRQCGVLGLGAAASLALVSCATSDAPMLPELTFAHLAPIRFNAATIEIVDLYRPPLAAPNVEHTFSRSTAAAARAWARQRIAAAGGDGTVTVTIDDASVVAVPLTTRPGVMGLFFDQQSIRYDATLEVTIEYDGPLVAESSARSRVLKSQTVPESISLNEKDQVFYDLLEGLMQDLDEQLAAAIDQYMTAVLVQA